VAENVVQWISHISIIAVRHIFFLSMWYMWVYQFSNLYAKKINKQVRTHKLGESTEIRSLLLYLYSV